MDMQSIKAYSDLLKELKEEVREEYIGTAPLATNTFNATVTSHKIAALRGEVQYNSRFMLNGSPYAFTMEGASMKYKDR